VEKEQTNKTDSLLEVQYLPALLNMSESERLEMLWNGTVNKTGEPWAAHTQNSKRKTPDNLPSLAPCLQAVVQHFRCWDLSVWDRSTQPMTAPLISLLPKHSALTAALSSFLRFPTIHILICHSHST